MENQFINLIIAGITILFQVIITAKVSRNDKDHDKIIRMEERIKNLSDKIDYMEDNKK